MTLNPADRKSVRAAERLAREAARARGEVLANLMSTTAGREYIWTQLEAANVFSSTYNDSPLRMAFAEGLRASGLTLLNSLMQFCPDLFIQAMREANARRSEFDFTPEHPDADPADSELPRSEESGRDDQGPTGPTVNPDTGEVIWN